MLSDRHANFILNVGDASATSIRSLSHHAKRVVFDEFGVDMEEEALFLGNWQSFEPELVA
jgi:UDP-N-acetylmuramate dehydrogenase